MPSSANIDLDPLYPSPSTEDMRELTAQMKGDEDLKLVRPGLAARFGRNVLRTCASLHYSHRYNTNESLFAIRHVQEDESKRLIGLARIVMNQTLYHPGHPERYYGNVLDYRITDPWEYISAPNHVAVIKNLMVWNGILNRSRSDSRADKHILAVSVPEPVPGTKYSDGTNFGSVFVDRTKQDVAGPLPIRTTSFRDRCDVTWRGKPLYLYAVPSTLQRPAQFLM